MLARRHPNGGAVAASSYYFSYYSFVHHWLVVFVATFCCFCSHHHHVHALYAVPLPNIFALVYSPESREYPLDFYESIVVLTEAYLNDYFENYNYTDNDEFYEEDEDRTISFSQVELYLSNTSDIFHKKGGVKSSNYGRQADIHMGGHAYYLDEQEADSEDHVREIMRNALIVGDSKRNYRNFLGQTDEDFFNYTEFFISVHFKASYNERKRNSYQRMFHSVGGFIVLMGLLGCTVLVALAVMNHRWGLRAAKAVKEAATVAATAADTLATAASDAMSETGSHRNDRKEELLSAHEREREERATSGTWA